MSFPDIPLPYLPPNTIVPSPLDQEDIFIQYFNRLYEDIALAMNSKDFNYFTIAISSTAVNIPNINNFGAYLVCVSGTASTQPCATWSLCKSTSGSAGSIALLGSQAGTGSWGGNVLTITSTASNFQIAHNRTGVTANFNIRIVGTQ